MAIEAGEKRNWRKLFTGAVDNVTDVLKREKKPAESAPPALDGTTLAEQFKEWVHALPAKTWQELNVPNEAEFKLWLNGLASDDLHTLTQQVQTFCRSLNFDAAWLFDPSLMSDPQLQQSLGRTVLLYGVAYWQGLQAQDGLQTFITFREWVHNPLAAEHLALTQQVFTRLVEAGLVPEPTSALVLFSEEERHNYVQQALHQAAEKDMTALVQCFKETREQETPPSDA